MKKMFTLAVLCLALSLAGFAQTSLPAAPAPQPSAFPSTTFSVTLTRPPCRAQSLPSPEP